MTLKDKVIIGVFIAGVILSWFTSWVYLVTGLWLPVEIVKNVLN